MTPFVLSSCVLALSAVWGQSTPSGGGSLVQIPYGQTYKNFQFPLYQNGEKTAMLSAVEAKGVSLNRAATTNLKIELYENGKITTTITSPLADLYMNDRKMRTKNTVDVVRPDMEATAQSCDFDMSAKKYLMRTNVKVVLKNFDTNTSLKPLTVHSSPATSSASTPTPPPMSSAPIPPNKSEMLLETPGAYASTNTGPIAPGAPANQ